MTITNHPETKLTYGTCFNATHLHREVMDGNYTICDHTATYWPSTIEAKAYEGAKTAAIVTGSVGATEIITHPVRGGEKPTVATEQTWKRPKHSHPYGSPESSWVKSHVLDD